jgi:hypothetical protein
MIEESAQIVTDWAPRQDNSGAIRNIDPVAEFIQLRRSELEHQSLAEDARLHQMRILHEHGSDPQMQALLWALRESRPPGEYRTMSKPISIEEFFDRNRPFAESPVPDTTKPLTDRSRLSPKLQRILAEKFPEASREERIRMANERPLVTLGHSLPIEVARYFAEDPDFLYDTE